MVRSSEVALALEAINRRLRAHAGGVGLTQVSAEGVVRLRFTGMCTARPLRPLTTATTIRPALLEIDGVIGVETEGSVISKEAQARMRRYLDMGPLPSEPRMQAASRPQM